MTEDSNQNEERNAFVVLVVFLAPILAVAIVGGYGFAVWMSQLILGPPGGH
ncbi:MAG: periplasmic nitrate reductase, NapE protein [Halieaceae bacterium]|nr:periplasmic nitrate reductase, NapE protein [Halieaceae bacterium]